MANRTKTPAGRLWSALRRTTLVPECLICFVYVSQIRMRNLSLTSPWMSPKPGSADNGVARETAKQETLEGLGL
jgi:hypothetical protein